jgi:hypothetical protein
MAEGGASLDINQIVPGLNGFYWEGTCSGNNTASGKNCPFFANGVTTCQTTGAFESQGTTKSKMFNVGGTSGQRYTATIVVRGIVGTRCYTGGTIASMAVPSTTSPNNTWYVGGQQFNNSIWNTYELHLNPAPQGAANVYFLNATGTNAINTDWCQVEGTIEVGYTASFSFVGGSTMTFTIHDANCQAQQNCGPSTNANDPCNMPRTVNLSDLSPPGTFTQPPTNTIGSNVYKPQWLYIVVKSLTSP